MREQIVARQVEALCQHGCREVRRVLRRLDRGEPVAGTEGLDAEEREALRRELESVMAVYDRRPRAGRGWGWALGAAVAAWFGLMLAASHWAYHHKSPRRVADAAAPRTR